MPRNGSGIYTLPAGNPIVSGTTISSIWANNTLSDIGTGLTQSISKDGQTTLTANLPISGFKLTGLGAGSADGDSVRYEQVGTLALSQGVTAAITAATPAASTSTSGKVQLATGAEAIAAADSLKAITPSTMKTGLAYSSGAAPIFACRAFAQFGYSGATLTFRIGANVSSITRVGVGQYQVSFSVAMPSTNYAAIPSARASDNTMATVQGIAIGVVQINTASAVGSGLGLSFILTDCDPVSVAVFV